MTDLGVPEAPAELQATILQVFEPLGWIVSALRREPESAEYAAWVFEVNGAEVRFRQARTTPAKAGQFVTIWARVPAGPIRPFDMADPVALFIVSVCSGEEAGQFVFSKVELQRQGVVSRDGIGGKRAIRVYPPWDVAPNRHAQRSQAWQSEFFLGFGEAGVPDLARAKALYASISDNIP